MTFSYHHYLTIKHAVNSLSYTKSRGVSIFSKGTSVRSGEILLGGWVGCKKQVISIEAYVQSTIFGEQYTKGIANKHLNVKKLEIAVIY